MKCHYEVLDVPRDADDAEIKTAYKKCALKWHPDKNLDEPDLAKEQFQLLQQAYEVLSDRHERAWYDNHREQILQASRNKASFQDSSLDVFQYFSSSCFKGFGNEPGNFYDVYKTVFEKIASEDIEYLDTEEEFSSIPPFGDSQSDYETVVGPFYAYWTSYSTKKSYVWLDPYDILDARNKDRRFAKLIDKENKKVRSKAKKERNEEVRNLVAFVRKRDKRVQAHTKLLELKTMENRKKNEEIRRQKIMERTQQLDDAKEHQQEWTKFENMTSELRAIEKNLAAEFGEDLSESDFSESDESDGELDSMLNKLYCVACNKLFKTEKAFKNHESSRKHRENWEMIKTEMDEDEKLMNINTNGNLEGEINSSKKSDTENDLSDETEEISKTSKKSKTKKKKKPNFVNSDLTDEEIIVDLDFNVGLSKKQKKKNQREQTLMATSKREIQSDEKISSHLPEVVEPEHSNGCCEPNENISETNTKKNKRKKKYPSTDINDIDTSITCGACKSQFSSKNKLFDHLKKTGHSIALPEKNTKVNVLKSAKRKQK